jgi:hypothetical protein
MNNGWTLPTTSPIYNSAWPLPERGALPSAPVLLWYWHNAQFVIDVATGDILYRVQHDPIWMHYSSIATWPQTRAGKDYMRAIQTPHLFAAQ